VLKLYRYNKGLAMVEYVVPEKEWPELVDYNPVLQRFDTIRYGYLLYPEQTTVEQVQRSLAERPLGMIYNVLSHDPQMTETDRPNDLPLIAEEQRIKIDGVPYVDVFGFYVYIASHVSWAKRSDVDLRFNANHYPYTLLEPELKFLFGS
jgi:hypothetical protein